MESQQSATFRLWFPNIYMTEAPSPSCVYSTVTLCISCSLPAWWFHPYTWWCTRLQQPCWTTQAAGRSAKSSWLCWMALPDPVRVRWKYAVHIKWTVRSLHVQIVWGSYEFDMQPFLPTWFQADIIIRLSLGLVLMVSITWASWSTPCPL